MKRRGGGAFPRGGGGGARGGRGHGSFAGASFSEKRRRLNVDGGQKCRGVFLSTNTNEKSAIREFMNLMQQYLSNDGTSNDAEEGQNQAEGRRSAADEVSEGLTSELQELRHQQSRFIPLKDLIKGVTYIQFNKEGDVPSTLVHGLMRHATTHRETISCRHISRLVPVDITTEPNLESFRQGLRELIAKTMPHSRAAERVGGSQDGEKQAGAVEAKVQGEASLSAKETADVAGNAEGGGKPEDSRNEEKKAETDDKDKQAPASQWVSTWSCQYTSRSFDTVKKQQILDLLTDEVGPSYKVNLKESEFSIIVECNPIFFGASIARDYGLYARYNLHRCCHPEEDAGQAGGHATRPKGEASGKDATGTASPGNEVQPVVEATPGSNGVASTAEEEEKTRAEKELESKTREAGSNQGDKEVSQEG